MLGICSWEISYSHIVMGRTDVFWIELLDCVVEISSFFLVFRWSYCLIGFHITLPKGCRVPFERYVLHCGVIFGFFSFTYTVSLLSTCWFFVLYFFLQTFYFHRSAFFTTLVYSVFSTNQPSSIIFLFLILRFFFTVQPSSSFIVTILYTIDFRSFSYSHTIYFAFPQHSTIYFYLYYIRCIATVPFLLCSTD